MRVLMIGDIVGRPGRQYLDECLNSIKGQYGPDMIIANVENAAGGMGITFDIADELLAKGIDVLTSGNHVWDKREVLEFIDDQERLLRPHNYPPGTPGRGYTVVQVGGQRVAVLNLSGRVFFAQHFSCPFRAVDEILNELEGRCDCVLLDFHAEATSEKVAMGWYVDGRVAAVFGTHTHVQTADEMILPNHTAYITDVGMTGPYESVIGMCKTTIIERYLTQLPSRFEVARGKRQLCAVLVETEGNRARSIERIFLRE